MHINSSLFISCNTRITSPLNLISQPPRTAPNPAISCLASPMSLSTLIFSTTRDMPCINGVITKIKQPKHLIQVSAVNQDGDKVSSILFSLVIFDCISLQLFQKCYAEQRNAKTPTIERRLKTTLQDAERSTLSCNDFHHQYIYAAIKCDAGEFSILLSSLKGTNRPR